VTFAGLHDAQGNVQSQSTPNTHAFAYKAGAWRGYDQLFNAAFGRHTLLGGNSSTFPLLLSDSLTRLRDGTVVVANTHGGVNEQFSRWFQATDTDVPKYIYTINVGGAVASKQALSIPDYNLVLMYACSTIDLGMTMPIAFKVLAPNQDVIPDRAYIGFDETFYIWKPINGGYTVDYSKPYYKHFDYILNEMKAGKPLADAVSAANSNTSSQIFCQSGISVVNNAPAYSPATVSVVGDDYMRLRYVYLTASEYNNLTVAERNVWYLYS